MMNRTMSLVTMLLGLGATFLVFMLRYGWYTNSQTSLVLNMSFVAFFVVCGLAWFVFPSKFLAMAACIALFIFPPIFDRQEFVALDWQVAPFIAISTLLVVAAIEMRRKIMVSKIAGDRGQNTEGQSRQPPGAG